MKSKKDSFAEYDKQWDELDKKEENLNIKAEKNYNFKDKLPVNGKRSFPYLLFLVVFMLLPVLMFLFFFLEINVFTFDNIINFMKYFMVSFFVLIFLIILIGLLKIKK